MDAQTTDIKFEKHAICSDMVRKSNLLLKKHWNLLIDSEMASIFLLLHNPWIELENINIEWILLEEF